MIHKIINILVVSATSILTACSNSETVGTQEESTITEPPSMDSLYPSEVGSDTISDYLLLDDTEYPYAGVPRIVIETEDYREIKDRETEIPAKLQIWGEKTPESEIMTLTIRGRGNSSWDTPKKSYKIEFIDKQSILGMPEDRDWALISNYADKTLMKNYLMYHLSAKLGAYYAPRCEFAELFINKEYLGVYLITETIKIGKNRINIPQNDNSYIVEFDAKYREDEQVIFSKILQTSSNGKAFRVHTPKNATKEILSEIEKHITDFELYLKTIHSQKNKQLEQWIDVDDYIKHYWVQEFSKNPDAWFYTSVYFSWIKGGIIKMGPVWDFDLAFGGHANELPFDEYANLGRLESKGWYTNVFYWNKYLFNDSIFSTQTNQFWIENKNTFYDIPNYVDSLTAALYLAAINNFKKWDILQSTKYIYHRQAYNAYEGAVEDLKKWINERLQWVDKEISPL